MRWYEAAVTAVVRNARRVARAAQSPVLTSNLPRLQTSIYQGLGRIPGTRIIWVLAGEAGGVLVDAFAETAFQACGEGDGGFAVAVAQLVGGRERLAPALAWLGFEQAHLALRRSNEDACTPSSRTALPCFQFLRNRVRTSLVDFGVELSGLSQRVRARVMVVKSL